VSGSVRVAVHSRVTPRRVTFALDGSVRDVDRSRPFVFGRSGLLDTRRLSDGPHRLVVRVWARGRRTTFTRRFVVRNRRPAQPPRGVAAPPASTETAAGSDARALGEPAAERAPEAGDAPTEAGTVSSDEQDRRAPAVRWSALFDQATVAGVVDGERCEVRASDDRGIDHVHFSVNGSEQGTAWAPPYRCSIDTRGLPEGRHTVTATAYDAAGNAGQHAVEVTVSNEKEISPVFADDFNGPAGALPDPRKWTAEVGGEWGHGTELQQYTARPENASLDGRGSLSIVGRPEDYTGPDGVTRAFTSARLSTQDKYEFRYGRIEARIKLPAGKGLLPAFWTLGADVDAVGWPAAGEIDIVEMVGEDPATVYGGLHGSGAAGAWKSIWPSPGAVPFSGDFHEYSVEWLPGGVFFAVDGRRYASFRPEDVPRDGRWPFDDPQFLILNLAIGNVWGGPPDASTPWPATMLVDWVRVWR
jgi:beta-glucanase (GH16 family)